MAGLPAKQVTFKYALGQEKLSRGTSAELPKLSDPKCHPTPAKQAGIIIDVAGFKMLHCLMPATSSDLRGLAKKQFVVHRGCLVMRENVEGRAQLKVCATSPGNCGRLTPCSMNAGMCCDVSPKNCCEANSTKCGENWARIFSLKQCKGVSFATPQTLHSVAAP